MARKGNVMTRRRPQHTHFDPDCGPVGGVGTVSGGSNPFGPARISQDAFANEVTTPRCPKCHRPLVARMGRGGVFWQCGC